MQFKSTNELLNHLKGSPWASSDVYPEPITLNLGQQTDLTIKPPIMLDVDDICEVATATDEAALEVAKYVHVPVYSQRDEVIFMGNPRANMLTERFMFAWFRETHHRLYRSADNDTKSNTISISAVNPYSVFFCTQHPYLGAEENTAKLVLAFQFICHAVANEAGCPEPSIAFQFGSADMTCAGDHWDAIVPFEHEGVEPFSIDASVSELCRSEITISECLVEQGV